MRKLPRLKIAHLPTPVEALPRLSAELSGPRIYIKRDDQTGLALGGNKTRKIEYFMADAQSHRARTIITTGAAQSNHCRQVAAAAARFGYDCFLVLTGGSPKITSGNFLLDHLLGAEIVWTDVESRDQTLNDVFQDAWDRGRRPYLIPYGGSNPLGAAAYLAAFQELDEQIKLGETPMTKRPDWIVFASSSGGTQAGLVLGERLLNYDCKILGISVDEPSNQLKHIVSRLAMETAAFLGVDIHVSEDEVLVNSDYTGGGYGVLGELEKNAIKLFARTEGLLLDPVYTGRAAGGMIALIHAEYIGKDDSVLFWHTGGTPALFADKYQDLAG
jgi:D-cysteine desulfhydrase family pyridoxal phosphate-dependent enzyme